MNQLETEATVGRLYLALVEAKALNAQLAELVAATAPQEPARED